MAKAAIKSRGRQGAALPIYRERSSTSKDGPIDPEFNGPANSSLPLLRTAGRGSGETAICESLRRHILPHLGGSSICFLGPVFVRTETSFEIFESKHLSQTLNGVEGRDSNEICSYLSACSSDLIKQRQVVILPREPSGNLFSESNARCSHETIS